MKNRILVSAFALIFSIGSFARSNKNISSHLMNHSRPSLEKVSSVDMDPNDGAKEIIQEIIDVVGLTPNFEIREANIPNAAAVIHSGKRYILYNPDFFAALTKATGSKWAAVSVLAHEIGHHLDGHTLSQIGSQPQSELEADEFSGFVLRKMGASLSDAQVAMKTAASQRGDESHPGQYDRLVAIENGWDKADAQLTGKKYTARALPQTNQTAVNSVQDYPAAAATRQPAIEDRSIIGDVRFNADNSASYYVTTRYNLVKVKDNQISVIGKLATLDSRQFPYMIYDTDNNQLFVDRYGDIVTKGGTEVGKMTAR